MSGAAIPTRFTKRYGTYHPFVQAGMAFAGWSIELAAAVCRAGGIGGLGAALLPSPAVVGMVEELKRNSSGPFHINFLAPFDHEEQVKSCVEAGARIISFHWDLPRAELVQWLKNAGCDVWQQVGSLDQARRALDLGVDAIIAQGHEAGGHNYQGRSTNAGGNGGGIGTFALVPAMRDALGDEPLLLAAGGIADGRGVAAALHLGADGVWVGTRLIATDEACAHPEYKRRLVEATCDDTIYTSIFGADDASFNPMRVLKNRTVSQWNDRIEEVIDQTRAGDLPLIGHTVIGGQKIELTKFDRVLPTPDTRADWEEVPFTAGQGVGLIGDIRDAESTVEQMMRDAEVALMRGACVRV